MGPVLIGLLSIVVGLLLWLRSYAVKISKYWEERGIPYVKPVLILGNSWRNTLQLATIGECHKDVCDKFPNEPMVGYFDFMSPKILIQDPGYVEKVLIKDFPHFMDHGFPLDEKSNPLEMNLFNMSGKRWRALRNKLSPVFTTGKLRIMYEQMLTLGDSMKEVLDKENLKCLELKDIIARFSMDVIGSCAFGINPGNLENGDSEFRRMGIKSFTFSTSQILFFILLTIAPNLVAKLPIAIGFTRKDVQKYFCGIIKETLEYRRRTKTKRNDFIDLMIQLQEKGHVEIKTKDPDDAYLGLEDHFITDTFEIDDDCVTAQAFVFLTGGFEAVASETTFSCYEFSKNIPIQEKARKNVLQRLRENNGKLDFDSVKEMDYLEMCVKETLRKYTPTPAIFRTCTKEYTFPNGYTMKPGEFFTIAANCIHLSPDTYPEPDKFDPERFSPDKFIPPGSYIPFGDGPRVCIAMRFALLQIKFALAKILANYKLKLNPKTKEPIKFSPKVFFSSPLNPIYFDVEKIANN